MLSTLVRIELRASYFGTTMLRVTAPWWPVQEIFPDRRFAATSADSLHSWTAQLSAAEFVELHEKFRVHATKGLYASPAWAEQVTPILQSIDLALAGGLGGAVQHAEVEIFQFDSGLRFSQ